MLPWRGQVDIGGNVVYSDRVVEITCRTVGKGDLRHKACSISGDPTKGRVVVNGA